MIRIHAIRDRAQALKVSLKELCDAAGVHHASPYRWLDGASAPRLDVFADRCARLERELTRREAAMRQHLDRLAAGCAA